MPTEKCWQFFNFLFQSLDLDVKQIIRRCTIYMYTFIGYSGVTSHFGPSRKMLKVDLQYPRQIFTIIMTIKIPIRF